MGLPGRRHILQRRRRKNPPDLPAYPDRRECLAKPARLPRCIPQIAALYDIGEQIARLHRQDIRGRSLAVNSSEAARREDAVAICPYGSTRPELTGVNIHATSNRFAVDLRGVIKILDFGIAKVSSWEAGEGEDAALKNMPRRTFFRHGMGVLYVA